MRTTVRLPGALTLALETMALAEGLDPAMTGADAAGDPGLQSLAAACLAGVVVPLRSFRSGKSRLGDSLDSGARAKLVASMAERVIAAAGPLPVVVVTSASEVRAWATARGLEVLEDPGTLNDAAKAGVRWAGHCGLPRAVVAHADLPFAESLVPLARDGGLPVVTAVPCHRDDGTPVLSVPTNLAFDFAYGLGSFRHHAAEAHRRGLAFRVVRDPALSHDVDVADDLPSYPGTNELRTPNSSVLPGVDALNCSRRVTLVQDMTELAPPGPLTDLVDVPVESAAPSGSPDNTVVPAASGISPAETASGSTSELVSTLHASGSYVMAVVASAALALVWPMRRFLGGTS